METNYKLKPKRSLRPLKTGLLVLAMVCFGLGTFAQQNKAVHVANDLELLNAVENPAVKAMVLEAGYYASLQRYLGPGVKAVKMGDGGRAADCVYAIQESEICFDPIPPATTVCDTARAFSIDFNNCGCCPGNDQGTWSYISGPGTLTFSDPLSSDTMEFCVDTPGAYLLRYTWGAPWNSHVQTEYFFYGPPDVTLDAEDVCGLSTMVYFTISSAFEDPNRTVEWTLNGQPYPGPETTSNFLLEVDWCGLHVLQVIATPTECDPDTATIWIDFSCEPVADAGPDIEVCEGPCYYSLIGNTGLYQTWSTNYAFSWNQISGPGSWQLIFDDNQAETTYVCRDEGCSYGEYEIEFSVVNGECYDADTMLLTFYEQPTADAGPDQFWCALDCFNLDATPYSFCSPPLGNERSAWWEPVSGPAGVIIDDVFNPDTEVCIQLPADCPYGEFVFKWVEVNGTCRDSDYVSIFIFEEPVADAGPDSLTTCFMDECFTIYGVGYNYCSTMPEGFTRTHAWELISAPAGFDSDCGASWGEGQPYEFGVCIGDCSCPYGEFTVALHEYNNDPTGAPICQDSDTVRFFLFEPTVADAGEDFSMCYDGGCFSLGAVPFDYCTDPAPDWGDRYGEWTKIAGPCDVEFFDAMDPDADACPDECECPYGVYTFERAEYNGDCEDRDTVVVTLFEEPTADAGDDWWYCLDAEFSMQLWHTFGATPYEYCQQEGLDTYTYWSKCDGPGVVTWYENQNNPSAWVHVSCFGCYCFVYHEVNGDCEDTDTVYVCWYEHPYLAGEDLTDSACTSLPVCYDLGELGIVPYDYLPGCHVNYNYQYWEMIAGAGTATFDPDIHDPEAEVCVDEYGCYTFQFIQYNGVEECADTVKADLWFFEDPIADAGADDEVCGPCYYMSAVPYNYVVNDCHPADDASHFWQFYDYIPPDEFCGIQRAYSPCFDIVDMYDPNTMICVCPDDNPTRDGIYGYGNHYGTYGFIWTEINGECEDSDTVWITFKHVPDSLPITGCVHDDYCADYYYYVMNGSRGVDECGCATCWWPDEDVMTVCANTCGTFYIDWGCVGGGPIEGYTYEWSFTGPAGSSFEAVPLWYDCTCLEWKGWDWVHICFGECCDTARLYLTITSPEGCVTTEEWKFYVQHPPDATVSGPEIAEVSSVFEYTIPDPLNPCYLYVWEVQHCGEIVYGQGTGTIGVHWTDYNQNGGWGIVSVSVYDTCTCCCNVDTLLVRVLPQGSLGDGTLSGHVYYENVYNTPLNGVKLTLWNSGVPIFETYSFNDIEGGNGVGYYAFEGINEVTDFGLTAEYMAPWYGANATDALAIELQWLYGTYPWTPVQWEAGDVNASGGLSATDALWVKQRAIAMVNHFPAGDWAFDNMNSTAGTYDVFTLNYGDVNHSNIPSSSKDMPAVAMVIDGTINVVPGEVFELPIRVADAVSLGAITLNLGYNSNVLEVVEVLNVDGALSNVTSTNIAMAWSDVDPMVLNNNDAIVSLRLKALGEISTSDLLFTIELGTEFADPEATVLEDLTLKTFGVSTDPAAVDYFLSYNRPNPFSTSTQIEYILPETGKVRLSVVDLLGQEIALVVDQTQSAGSYTVQFNAAGLAPGVYVYKITVQGETRDFVETRRMVISH